MNNLKIIMCVDNTGGFSKDGVIPWFDETGKNKYPDDFKHFKNITKNSICVMGRRTYEDIVRLNKLKQKEIKDHIFPNRKSYVLSRNDNFKPVGAERETSIRNVYNKEEGKTIFVIGGEKLIIEALSSTDEIYLTVIDEYYKCDKFFPLSYLQKYFKIESGEKKDNLYFVKYRRIKS